ncbi:peptidase [Sporosalibacterium faouarense]|uniref:peptidase n=1 Tax=Sporosalibacterium faouarense TaxID=516123 RepID=UPI00192AEDC2|nr:peptidase [Sporosalibacterium faouarense]
MIATKKLEEIIDKCGIILKFIYLPNSVLAYYTFDSDYYIILINESIRNNERLCRTVLAEEIGHYRTTIGDITPRKYMSYRDKINVDKKELLDLRWVADFIIPTDQLLSFMKATLFDPSRGLSIISILLMIWLI